MSSACDRFPASHLLPLLQELCVWPDHQSQRLPGHFPAPDARSVSARRREHKGASARGRQQAPLAVADALAPPQRSGPMAPWSGLSPHSPSFSGWVRTVTHARKNQLPPRKFAEVPLSASTDPTTSGFLFTSFHLEDAGHGWRHHLVVCSGPGETVHHLNATTQPPLLCTLCLSRSLSLQSIS